MPALATHKVRDGLMTIEFDGELIESHHSYEDYDGTRPQWTETYLYWVDPGQSYVDANEPDGPDRIQLPDGGYLLCTIGQSVMYHRADGIHRGRGMPLPAGSLPDNQVSKVRLADAWPCPECGAPVLWRDLRGRTTYDSDAENADDLPGVLQVSPDLIVRLETPIPSVLRAKTASVLVQSMHSGRLLAPARRLLELAAQKRPDIQAALDGKRPPGLTNAP